MGLTLIDFYKGKDFNATFTFKNQNGDAIPITDYTIEFRARKMGSNTTTLTKSMTIIDADNGVARLSLDPADTTDLSIGSYAFQICGADDDSETHVYAEGKLFVREGF